MHRLVNWLRNDLRNPAQFRSGVNFRVGGKHSFTSSSYAARFAPTCRPCVGPSAASFVFAMSYAVLPSQGSASLVVFSLLPEGSNSICFRPYVFLVGFPFFAVASSTCCWTSIHLKHLKHLLLLLLHPKTVDRAHADETLI